MNIKDIKPRLQATRRNTADLARFLDVPYSIADNIVNARRKKLTADEADGIRRFFEKVEKPEYTYEETPERGSGVSLVTPRAEIPLFGGADTKDGWTISLAAHTQVGRVMAHPAQATSRRAFAVEVVDNTMSPRFEVAEIAYVSGGQMPARGQDCLVEYADLTARILQFMERSDKRIVLRQLNPGKQVIVEASAETKLHAIVGRG